MGMKKLICHAAERASPDQGGSKLPHSKDCIAARLTSLGAMQSKTIRCKVNPFMTINPRLFKSIHIAEMIPRVNYKYNTLRAAS